MQKHYQVIIIGDSLASRLAGVLLSKRGVRTLSFQRDGLQSDPWFQSSILLERLLDHLGGRSCYSAPLPLQVITDRNQLEFHGQYPFEEELRREFPAVHSRVAALLEQLARTADSLEDKLWQIGWLPLYGLGSRFLFACRRPGIRPLQRPLSSLLAEFSGTPAGAALDALFSGLALAPASTLTVGEGALLWGGTILGRGVSPSGLDTLLRHRYEQFHGENESLAAIQSLVARGDDIAEVVLKSGARCSADRFLLDAPEIWPLLPEAWRQRLGEPPASHLYTATVDETALHPLLAPRLILGGDPPLRLSLMVREGGVECTLRAPAEADRPAPGSEAIAARIRRLAPFAPPESQLRQSGRPALRAARSFFPGATHPLRVTGNLLFAHAPLVFPTLGTTGEVLTGLSSANRLLRELKQR